MVVFWQKEPLENLTHAQWEALCDGCGKCCVHKLQDEETELVYYTDVACHYLDQHSAQCSDYCGRLQNVPGCLNLNAGNLATNAWWLPPSCAYKRLYEGRDLPSWHPLKSGRRDSVQQAQQSVIGRVVSEREVDERDWQEHVVHWITEDE